MSPPAPGTVELPHPVSSLINTEWTKPEYTLPTPSLQFLFHLECDMESFKHIGEGPWGNRSTVIFKDGRFEGPKLRGKILPGGGGECMRSVPATAVAPLLAPELTSRLRTRRLGNRPQPRH